MMSPILKHVEGFVVIGLSTRTRNSDEFNKESAKIPNLWQQFYSTSLATNVNILSVYSDYESDANGLYTITIGIAADDTSAKFSSVKIQTGNYLVFTGKGPMPSTVIEIWQQIWSYFGTNTEYQRNYISDFEDYRGSDEVVIYIGIE